MLDKLLWSLVRYWLLSGTKFFFGIGMGPSTAEKTDMGVMSGAANFGIGQGEGDILKASKFWSDILSGDPTKIATVLGPQMSAANKQAQERKKTTAEFGNRGGGTNAVMQSLDDSTLSSIRSMVSNLTGSAASELGGMGSSLFSGGVSASGEAFDEAKTIHDENQAKWKDIFKSIMEAASAVAV